MVICRPESVGPGMWWSDVQADTVHHVVLQSSRSLFGNPFRIIVHQGTKPREKHYQVATGDSMEEIMKDWAFIQTIVNSKPENENEAPAVADPTLALVSLIFTRWKQQSLPNSLIIKRADSLTLPSSPSPAPSSPSHLSHSYSDPSLSQQDPHAPPPPLSSSITFLPPSSTDPTSQPLPSPPPPPHMPSEPSSTSFQPPPKPPSSRPPPPTSPPPSTQPPPPTSPPRSPSQTPSPQHPPTSHPHFLSHPNYPSTSISMPALLHPPPVTVLSTSPQKHILAQARAQEHQTTPTPTLDLTPHAPTPHNDKKHAAGSAVDADVVAEVIAWEKRRANLKTKMDALNKTKNRHLEGILNDYLETVRGIVMDEPGLSDQIKMNMISQEYVRLEALKETIFNTKTSAIINCVDDEIKNTERAGKMKRHVTKLQAITRGYLVRKKYRPQIKSRKQRNRCVLEFLETERTYVRLLELSVKVFLNPLRESSGSKNPLIRKDDVVTLFSNTESLLVMNKEFLASLEERISHWNPTSLLGDIIIRIAPYMKMYTQYVNSYNDSLNTLNKYSKSPDFKDFLAKAKANPELKSMDLASFLILPVQRIPRYVLLLQEIVKYTPADHPDYSNLQKALELIQEVARTINESKRQAENTNKVMAIQSSLIFGEKPLEDLVQPHRKFKKEGALTREVDSSIEDCYLFLFSDILLITQKRKGFMEDHYHFIFRDSLTFVSTSVRPIPDTRLWQHGFSLTSHSKTERFFAESATTKSDWMTAISEVIEEVKKNRQTLKVEEIPVAPEPEEPSNPPPSPTASAQNQPLTQSQLAQATQAPPSVQTHASHSHTLTHAHTPNKHQNRKSLMLNSPAQQAHTPTKLRQVVALYRQALQLEGEMFVLPYQIKTLLPTITVTPQNLQEIQSRVTLLGSRIIEIDTIQDTVMNIIREEKSVITLDRLISQGMVHIDSMLKFLTTTFPKEMAAQPPRASLRQSSSSNVMALSLPYQLMSSILSWYLSVSENWTVIMEKQV